MSEKSVFLKNSFFSYITKLTPLIFSFVYTIVLSNSLGAAAYGLFTYLASFTIGFVNLFGANLIDETLMNFTAQTRSKLLFKQVFLLQYILASAIFAGLYFFAGPFASGLEGSNSFFFLMASALLFFSPLTATFFALNQGLRKFDRIFVAVMIENFINLVGIIIMVSFLNFGIAGAFYSKFISLAFSGCVYLAFLRKTELSGKNAKKKDVVNYGVYGAFGEFLKQIINQAEVIIIGIFISPALLGVYYIANKIATIAIGAPTGAVSDVLFPMNSSNYKDKKKIQHYSSISIKGVFLVVLIVSVILLILAYPVLALLFPGYILAIQFIPLIIVREIVKVFGSIKTILNSINKTKQRTIQRAITAAIGVLALWVLVPAFGILGLIAAQVIAEGTSIILVYFILWKYNGIKIDLVIRKSDLSYFYRESKALFFKVVKKIK